MGLREKHGRWYYRFKLQGRDYEGSTGLEATRQNENAAKAIEAQQRLLVESGEPDQRIAGIPFPVAAEEFLEWCENTRYRQKPNSYKRIRGSFASLLDFFQQSPVTGIQAIDVERYKTHRANFHSVKDCTIRNDLNALSLFFQYARKAGWCSQNLLTGEDKVERPSNEDAVRIHVLSYEEEQAYFSAATVKPNRYQNVSDLGKLILLQGPRPEEVLSAKVAAFSERNEELRIEGGKSRAARRTLYLQGESVEILARRKRTSEKINSPWLFPNPHKPEYHLVQLNTTHDSLCQDAGVSFVIYDFRHTFATRMLVESGIDMATLAAIMGHSSIRILQKYVHPTAQHQRAAMKTHEAKRPSPKLVTIKKA